MRKRGRKVKTNLERRAKKKTADKKNEKNEKIINNILHKTVDSFLLFLV